MPVSILKPMLYEPTTVIEIDAGDPVDEAMQTEKRALVEMASEMVPPVHVAVLAQNGGGYLCRFELPGEAVFLAHHEPPKGLALPIHTLIVDAEGRTARLILRERVRGS